MPENRLRFFHNGPPRCYLDLNHAVKADDSSSHVSILQGVVILTCFAMLSSLSGIPIASMRPASIRCEVHKNALAFAVGLGFSDRSHGRTC